MKMNLFEKIKITHVTRSIHINLDCSENEGDANNNEILFSLVLIY
jgi:hypothetical protein